MRTPVTVRPVLNSRELNAFVTVPASIYRDSPYWVPPLWSDEKRGYDARTNPVLRNATFQCFVAWRGKEPVGRVLAYIDHAWNDHYRAMDGLFGALDAIRDPGVITALVDCAAAWLHEHGATRMVGPINPVAEFWGVLIEGFNEPPMFLTPWHPPEMDALVRGAGLEKEIDLYAWEADTRKEYTLSPRYEAFATRFLERHREFTIRMFDPRRFMEDAEAIWRISNRTLVANWGYVPVPREVFMDMVTRLRPIIDPEAVWFVERNGETVAFALGFPDINVIIKQIGGHLFPTGWIRFLAQRRRIRDFRLFGLAVEEAYHGLGLDALMYVHLYRRLARRGIRLEANYVLENNTKMNNALRRLGMNRTRTYRIYSRRLTDTATV